MAASREPTVRAIQDSDLHEVAELRWLWVVEDNGRIPAVDHEEFLVAFAQWAPAHADTHHGFVAVESSGRILGMAWLVITDQVPNPRGLGGRTGDLRSVFVLPSARNRGLGAALIKTAVERASTLGVTRVTVHSSQRAVSSYLRAGFVGSELLLHLPIAPS
jgi:GNAT superfamily N-acetyltransferase